MTILELLVQEEFSSKIQSSSDGSQLSSPCPGCGGVDRFVVWIEQGDGGRWWCRQCKKSGDNITYLMEFRGMSYLDACMVLGRDTKSFNRFKPRRQLNPDQWQPYPPKPGPSQIWESKAEVFVQNASITLWASGGQSTREWFMDRGLNIDTLKNYRLGINGINYEEYPPEWGLSPMYDDQAHEKNLYIPSGVVIPCLRENKIQRLRIRRFDQSSGGKYYIVPGSALNPMILGHGEAVVIVESELDALLINQEAGDLVQAIALGSVAVKPNTELTGILQKARIILVALDSDVAGAKAMWGWWHRYFPNSKRWPVLIGKDPSEAFQNGMDIRTWIIAGIPYLHTHLNKVAHVEGQSTSSRINAGLSFPDINYQVVSDVDSLKAMVAGLENHQIIAVNTKTTGDDPFSCQIRLVQVAADGKPVSLIDMTNLTREELHPLQSLFSKDSLKIFHNAKASLKFLQHTGINCQGKYFDTRLSEQILTAGLENEALELGDLFRKYLRMPFPKKLMGNDGKSPFSENHLKFAAREVYFMLELHKKVAAELETAKLTDTADLEFAVLPVVVEMEINGMRFDESRLEALHQELMQKKEELEKYLAGHLGPINFNSPDQLLKALCGIGINLPDTKKETLMAWLGNHRLLNELLQYRQVTTAIQNFSSKLPGHIHPATHRIHPNYDQLGTATGRFSCSMPNLQAIPRDPRFRRCMVPAPGYKFVIADYSQIELRVAAEISGDERMLQAYGDGDDLHKLTASLVAGKSMQEVTKEERQNAKAINFGLIFAMGAEGLKRYAKNTYGINMTLEEARVFKDRFFRAYVGIARWHTVVGYSGSHETRSVSGRRRLWDHNPPITELLNTPVQGTATDINKKALGILLGRLAGTEVKIIGTIHDEILLEAPEDQAEHAAGILKAVMIEAGSTILKKLPVEVEVAIADSWAEK